MHTAVRLLAAVATMSAVLLFALDAEAKSCVKKGAVGEATSQDGAKFQVDEALLQSVDWGAWAAWMASKTTPGYSFGPRAYSCSKSGSLGWTCHGRSTICKL
ncbi:MAG: hypothetical protein WC807_05960 [Hyphomicrobium sp.]|jgi:hypothetical protein